MKLRVYALLCLFACVATLLGQGTTSRAIGTVLDSSGAPVAGATVTLTNEGTNQAFTVSASDNGTYTFEAVQSGSYTVTVEAPGFKKFVSKNNIVTIGQPTTVNVRLEVGAVTESVEVQASYEQVQTSTSGNIGNLFSEKVIKDLPIVGTRGRNPLDLVTRQPGVVSGANTGGGFHVNGARDRSWNFTVDGIDANETSAGGSNFAPIRTNPDSLAEFRVLTGNTTAEFGRNSGGQVAMVTRSGSNEFHGSGFWFYRTPALNASEWQANLNGLGKTQFVQNIYGGSIGGRIIRNRTFFFANLQKLSARESAILDRTVYTQTARQGVWRYNRSGRNLPAGVAGAAVDAQGNVLPGASIGSYNIFTSDPQRIGQNTRIRDIIARTPLPNFFDGGDGLNTAIYRFAALQNEKQYDATVKVDHIINSKNTVFARISWGQQDTNCDRVNGGAPFFPDGDCVVNTKRNPRNYAFNWRSNPTSRLTNEFVFGRNFFAFDFLIPSNDLNGLSLTGAPITVPETFDFGNKRELNTWQIVNNTSYFLGAHTLRWGLNFRLASHNDVRGSIGGSNSTTQVNFSRLVNTVDAAAFGLPADINQQFDRNPLESNINFLLGRVGDISRGFIAEGDRFVPGVYDFKANFNEYDLYLQDTWKLRKNLTIDLGLRWEAKMAPTSDPGRIRRPSTAFTAGAPSSTTLRWDEGSLYNDDLNNFAPSIGFAWDPFGNGKTSIRSNYRLAFDRINTFVLSSAVFQNLPGIVQGRTTQELGQAGGRLPAVRPLDPPTTSPSSFSQPPAFSLNSITVVDPDFETPQTHQWSFGIQRQIAKATVVEVNYIGRRAHNLFGAYNSNQVLTTQRGFIDAIRTVQAGGESALINQLMTPDTRRLANETGSTAVRRLYAADLRNNAAGTIANDISRRTIAGGVSQVTASGLGTGFLVPFPQFTGALNVIDSNDFSTYHALQMQIDRRFANGLTFQVAYTWSKSLDTRSFDPAFTTTATGAGQSASSTPFDIYNRRYNYAPSDFDRTHVLQSYWVWELPFGKGKRLAGSAGPWTNRVIGGWQIAGFMTYSGGRPFTVYSGVNTVYNTVNSTADCTTCQRGFGDLRQEGGLVWYLSPEERAAFASTTALGSVGSTGRNFFRGPRSFGMDMSLNKRIAITDRMNLELRADVTNFTNTPSFGFPTTSVNSATFGRIRDTVISGSRKIQLGAKFNF